MTITGKTIAVIAVFQVIAVIIARLGARLAVSVVRHMAGYEYDAPGITGILARRGSWLLLVPLLWSVVVFARLNRDAPAWELSVWLLLGAAFVVTMGGLGVAAVLAPFHGCGI
jgi:hypothetical protein